MKRFYKILSVITLLVMIISSIPFTPASAIDSFVNSTRFGTLFGDVDSNGEVEAGDALLILKHTVSKVTLSESQLIIGDVDENDLVNASDALCILQYCVGKIADFPAGDVYEDSSNTDSSDSDSSVVPDNQFTPVSSSNYLAYQQLTEVQQSVYNIAYENVKAVNTDAFSVGSARTVSVVDMMLGVQAMIYDHPELFWVMTSFAYSSVNYGNRIVQFYDGEADETTYIYNPSDVAQMQVTLDAKIDEIFAETINPSMSQSEIALALHDWLVNNASYNYDALEEGCENDYAWSAYSAIVDGTAICEGLSKAYQLLLYRAGINCGLAVSSGHMWNYVNIDGEWYYTDITWDDRGIDGVPLYHFYNQTYEVFSTSREFCANIEDLSESDISRMISLGTGINFNFNVPKTTSTKANWFYQNNLVFEDIDDFGNRINSIMIEYANNGKKNLQVMILGTYFTSSADVSEYRALIDYSYINQSVVLQENKITSMSYLYQNNACGFILKW